MRNRRRHLREGKRGKTRKETAEGEAIDRSLRLPGGRKGDLCIGLYSKIFKEVGALPKGKVNIYCGSRNFKSKPRRGAPLPCWTEKTERTPKVVPAQGELEEYTNEVGRKIKRLNFLETLLGKVVGE